MQSAGNESKTIERYDPTTDEWQIVGKTKRPHKDFGAAAHNNKIYILCQGGFEVFHLQFNNSKTLPLRDFRDGAQLAWINAKLLALGGSKKDGEDWQSIRSIFEFETIEKKMETIAGYGC